MMIEISTPSGWKVVSDASLQDAGVDAFVVSFPIKQELQEGQAPDLRLRIGGREAVTVVHESSEPRPGGGTLVRYQVQL